ncbi:MAG: YceH family protein [Rhodocyclaceae bacterium]|jgi:uncharacterized protein
MSEHPLPPLSLLETRVLGVLVEKQLTTPDYYPLTLNALLAGCNQKSARHPVLNATEGEVQMVLDDLKRHTLVVESTGASGRVARYAHNIDRVLRLPSPVVALLASLMLRGPQTPGELRVNCDRLYRFPDISALEAYLDEMAARPAGALVLKLPKQPGSREHRYAHLLSGTPDVEADPGFDVTSEREASIGEIAALKANVAQMREDIADLRRLVERLYAELDLTL